MDIQYAILGFLSWKPLAGYDLKKLFSESSAFYWSGNNNQIYRALVDLHQADMVSLDVQPQDNLPARKVYSITDQGLAALKTWLVRMPELPEVRNSFLVQLAWADLLSPAELDHLLAAYAEELRMALLMQQEKDRRTTKKPDRTPREAILWQTITDNIVAGYETELRWVENLRKALVE
jgi:PadR family transcriptional regulator AphA